MNKLVYKFMKNSLEYKKNKILFTYRKLFIYNLFYKIIYIFL